MPWNVGPGVKCPVCGEPAARASTHWFAGGAKVLVTIWHQNGSLNAHEWIVGANRYMVWEGRLNAR